MLVSGRNNEQPDPRESAEIMVNGEVVGYGMDGMGAALRKLLAPDDEPADEEAQDAS